MQGKPEEVKKEDRTMVRDLLEHIDSVQTISTELVDRLYAKLAPVMIEPEPSNEKTTSGKCSSYPPLFAEIDDKVWTIEQNLMIIHECLNRTQL